MFEKKGLKLKENRFLAGKTWVEFSMKLGRIDKSVSKMRNVKRRAVG